MKTGSLRARLALAALVSIALALLVASLGLVALFERHVERRIGAELTDRLNQLAAAVRVSPEGAIDVDPLPPDPRFEVPLSGLYWQIDDLKGTAGADLMRSRSLWDTELQLPRDLPAAGAVHAHILSGPGPGSEAGELIVRERSIRVGDAGPNGSGGRLLRLAVAQDRAELLAARSAFAADMLPYLGVIALVLGVATWLQIRTGLAPLESVRSAVNAIRAGKAERLPTSFPDEVQPLAGEVNALLAAREQAIEKARAWTADLAHGLKTPLSALAADAERLRQQGNPEVASDLEQLADEMRRRVDRELVRARVQANARRYRARTDVGAALRRLLRTLERTPDGSRLRWRLDAPNDAVAALDEQDLMELLGNLLENASKWARQQVEIEVSAQEQIEVSIGDDGPGVADAQLTRLGERGLRLDQRTAGSGLGLAIARDVVEAYGARLEFGRSGLGGLAAQVWLPRAP